ncbi:hypothetical protein HAX54_050478, partial [Datura stramonium]|nr:hypothetical protein [Datura stramonium]
MAVHGSSLGPKGNMNDVTEGLETSCSSIGNGQLVANETIPELSEPTAKGMD